MTDRNTGNRLELDLPSRLELLGVVDKVADGVSEFMSFEDTDRDSVGICVVEACTNAIQHGNHADPGKMIKLVFEMEEDTLVITVIDGGQGYSPDPDEGAAPPDLMATRGRGLFLMRSMMDEITFSTNGGTSVRMVKRRSAPIEESGEGMGETVLAVDWGARRVGFAVSEGEDGLGRSLPTVTVASRREAVEVIAAAAKAEDAGLIVLGLPLNASGSASESAERVRRVGRDLQRKGFPVCYQDERWTSQDATHRLRERGERRPARGEVDRMAALLILEAFLADPGGEPHAP